MLRSDQPGSQSGSQKPLFTSASPWRVHRRSYPVTHKPGSRLGVGKSDVAQGRLREFIRAAPYAFPRFRICSAGVWGEPARGTAIGRNPWGTTQWPHWR